MSENAPEETQNLSPEKAYVNAISVLCLEPGVRSRLRRMLRRPFVAENSWASYPEMYKALPSGVHGKKTRSAIYHAFAAYTAAYGTGESGLSLGRAVRRAMNSAALNGKAVEKKFIGIQRTPIDQVINGRLPELLSYMHGADIVPDMGELLQDVIWCSTGRRAKVFTKWAYGAYSPQSSTSSSHNNQEISS